MKEAVFSLRDYAIVKALLNLDDIPAECGFDLDFVPSGIFDQGTGLFVLTLKFRAICQENSIDAVSVVLKAEFQFASIRAFEDIPSYFYPNSIAIIFPYIRAFVSTLTLQANVSPIMIPTLNLSVLENELKGRTTVK